MSDHDVVHLSAVDWSIVDSLQNKPSRQAFDESINQFKSINQHTINVAFKLWEYKQYPTIKAIEQLTTSVNQLLNQSAARRHRRKEREHEKNVMLNGVDSVTNTPINQSVQTSSSLLQQGYESRDQSINHLVAPSRQQSRSSSSSSEQSFNQQNHSNNYQFINHVSPRSHNVDQQSKRHSFGEFTQPSQSIVNQSTDNLINQLNNPPSSHGQYQVSPGIGQSKNQENSSFTSQMIESFHAKQRLKASSNQTSSQHAYSSNQSNNQLTESSQQTSRSNSFIHSLRTDQPINPSKALFYNQLSINPNHVSPRNSLTSPSPSPPSAQPFVTRSSSYSSTPASQVRIIKPDQTINLPLGSNPFNHNPNGPNTGNTPTQLSDESASRPQGDKASSYHPSSRC